MATATFNPLALARRLKDAGMDEPQAEAVADGLHEAVTENVATKADVAAVKADIAAVEKTLRAEMGAIKWMVGLTLALVLAVLARSFALI